MIGLRWLLALLVVCNSLPARAERVVTPLTDWKFVRRDASAGEPIAAWPTVSVPHSWNSEDGRIPAPAATVTADTPRVSGVQQARRFLYYRGPATYARTLAAPAAWRGKRVFIRFQAASQVAEVWLNGRRLGDHRGAFTAFAFELTGDLNIGGANELRVRVDNSWDADIAPTSGDFNVNGGLYRPVDLIVTDATGISPTYFGSSGLFATPRVVGVDRAEVDVRTMLTSDGRIAAPVTVETRIADARGRIVARRVDADVTVPQGIAQHERTLTIDHPRLWQGRRDPYLYTVTVRVTRGKHLLDEVRQPLGLRNFGMSQASGFLLNGRPYPIHGTARHQDFKLKGWAVTPSDEAEDARIILDLGATAVRNAHYPQSTSWHDLLDRAGLLAWNEVPIVNEITDSPAYRANVELQMREMVLQLYNHPSIAWWGIFNEIENLPTPPSAPLLVRLRDVARELDPIRVVAAASDHGERYYNKIPDEIGFNNYPGWYVGNWPRPEYDTYRITAEDMAPFIRFRAKEVGRRIAITEYGAGGSPDQQQEGPPVKPVPAHGGPFHPEGYQTWVHERDWAQMKDNPDLWGTFVWSTFDFTSSGRNEGGNVSLNNKALVTRDRKTKKDAYFLYQANWSDVPMVHINARRLVVRRRAVTAIAVYSNLERVELFLNGRSLGSRTPDDIRKVEWPAVTLSPGRNVVRAVASGHGRRVSDEVEWVFDAGRRG